MPWTSDSSGTKTATANPACTFTNASANVGVTNTCAANDMVVFATAGTLPTNFVAGTTYFVIATGLSGSNIQVSATKGGSAITAGSAGSGTHSVLVEHVVSEPTTNATYEFSVDTKNMVAGDTVQLRCYEMIDATNYAQKWMTTFSHAQAISGKASPPIVSLTQAKFSIRQLAGTGRAFPWGVRRI